MDSDAQMQLVPGYLIYCHVLSEQKIEFGGRLLSTPDQRYTLQPWPHDLKEYKLTIQVKDDKPWPYLLNIYTSSPFFIASSTSLHIASTVSTPPLSDSSIEKWYT